MLLLCGTPCPKTCSERHQEGIRTRLGYIQREYQQQQEGERWEEGLVLDVSFFPLKKLYCSF